MKNWNDWKIYVLLYKCVCMYMYTLIKRYENVCFYMISLVLISFQTFSLIFIGLYWILLIPIDLHCCFIGIEWNVWHPRRTYQSWGHIFKQPPQPLPQELLADVGPRGPLVENVVILERSIIYVTTPNIANIIYITFLGISSKINITKIVHIFNIINQINIVSRVNIVNIVNIDV
jgi:hypothetical protein